MHNKRDGDGGLPLLTLSSYCDTNPVACSWLAFYDDCEGQVRRREDTIVANLKLNHAVEL